MNGGVNQAVNLSQSTVTQFLGTNNHTMPSTGDLGNGDSDDLKTLLLAMRRVVSKTA